MRWLERFTELVDGASDRKRLGIDADEHRHELRAARLHRQGVAASKRAEGSGDHSSAFWLFRESGLSSERAERARETGR